MLTATTHSDFSVIAANNSCWAGQEPALFAGEAKSSAKGFADADADAEVAKAALCGAGTYIAVCLQEISASHVNVSRPRQSSGA